MKTDITILREGGNLYCLFLFENDQELQILKSHFDSGSHFSIQVTENELGNTSFYIKFLDVDYDFKLAFGRSVRNYPPLGWLRDNLPTYIRLGLFQDGGHYEYIPVDYPVSKVLLN